MMVHILDRKYNIIDCHIRDPAENACYILYDLFIFFTGRKPDRLTQISLRKVHTKICFFLWKLQLIHQVIQYIPLSDRLDIQYDTSGNDRRKDLVNIAGQQENDRILRWLLDCLEQSILCICI